MDRNSDIETILTKKNTWSNLNSLLIHRNIGTPLRMAENKYPVFNACLMNAIIAIIDIVYNVYYICILYIDF
jgi:hypothetical protein